MQYDKMIMNKDTVLMILWSINLGALMANLVWMIVTEISFQKRIKGIKDQIDKLKGEQE